MTDASTRLTANILTALADENTRLRAAGQQLADALITARNMAQGDTLHVLAVDGQPLRTHIAAALDGWADASGEQTPT